MPLYDFRCPKCGLEFEVSRPRSDAGNPAACPQDGTDATRVWSSIGFTMKDSGSSSPLDGGGGGAPDMSDFGGHGHGHSHGPGSHTH